MTGLVLRGARLGEGPVGDVLVEGGRVTAVARSGQLPSACDSQESQESQESQRSHGSYEEMDLGGFLLLPAPAEPHAHLDKALTWDLAGAPPCDLPGAVAAWRAHAEQVTEEDVLLRARRALEELVANGATAVRTHADVLPGPDPLRGLRALLRLREELRDRVTLQIAVLHIEAPDDVLDEALEAGADLLGGCPHLCADPEAAVARALTIAERHGVGVDLHADEHLNPDPRDLLLLAQAVRERGFAHGATASHCVGLGGLDPADAARIAKEAAASLIGVVALPLTNLYLQGRDTPARTPRGLTAVRALLDAGVPLAGGGDNIRDPFNPVGRADPLETAGLLVAVGHLTLPEAVHAVTAGARAVLGLPTAGPYEGAVADLLAVRADSLSEAVGASYPDRIVFKAGRPVSRTTVIREAL